MEYLFFKSREECTLNDRSVLINFDAFMSDLNRTERAFLTNVHKHWDEGGCFIVGDPKSLGN